MKSFGYGNKSISFLNKITRLFITNTHEYALIFCNYINGKLTITWTVGWLESIIMENERRFKNTDLFTFFLFWIRFFFCFSLVRFIFIVHSLNWNAIQKKFYRTSKLNQETLFMSVFGILVCRKSQINTVNQKKRLYSVKYIWYFIQRELLANEHFWNMIVRKYCYGNKLQTYFVINVLRV